MTARSAPKTVAAQQTTIPVNQGAVVFWSGPDHQNEMTRWATLRASEYERLAQDAAKWRGLRSRSKIP